MSTIFVTLHVALIIYLLIIFMVGIYGNRIYLEITKLANVCTQSIANLTSAVKWFLKYNPFHKNLEPVFIYYESSKLSRLLIVTWKYDYHFLNTLCFYYWMMRKIKGLDNALELFFFLHLLSSNFSF